MRKFVLFLISFISITVTAQRKNDKGEKIVSKLEICNYTFDKLCEKSVITYSYLNSKLAKLNKFTSTVAGGDIRTSKRVCCYNIAYTYSNGKISRTVPLYGIVDYVYAHDYVLNSQSKVKMVRERFRQGTSDGYVQYDYTYNDYGKLTQMYYRWYNKNRKSGTYVPEEDEYVIPIRWTDGNMYIEDRFRMTYSEEKNDLNISPVVFQILGDTRALFDDEGFVYSADWFGMKSDNLLSEVVYLNGVFESCYCFENKFDRQGNLDEIIVYYKRKSKWREEEGEWSLRKTIKITYLY